MNDTTRSTVLRLLGRQPYEPVWRRMQAFTDGRSKGTTDEIWFVEHPPVFTVGMNGQPEHLLAPGDIPVVHIDRGGQVTYHGPGQLVAYVMVDLDRQKLTVRGLVEALERAIVKTLDGFGIESAPRRDAPGVYVGDAKIASLGLRVRRGACYHGLAVNVAMDLEPFARINPCGFAGMPITTIEAQGGPNELDVVRSALAPELVAELGLPAPVIEVRSNFTAMMRDPV